MIYRFLVVGVTVILVGAAPEAKEAQVEQLVQQLGSDRFRLREQAQQKLLALGRPAVPALRAALLSQDPEVRVRARDILRSIQTSVEHLLDDLKSGTPAVRQAAAEALGQLGKDGKAAIPALVDMLKGKDETLRKAVASALAGIDPENKALAGHIPAQAHGNGKYAKLLRKIKVERDLQSYGKFSDYGYHPACDWGGHANLPAGYWVYVYPHWFIWGEQKGVAQPAPAPGLPR